MGQDLVYCDGCGAGLPRHDGPTHRYVGASVECWALFGQLQVHAYEDMRFTLHQSGLDAYMVQHPGTPSPQSIQSVTLHLISLCLQLEQGCTELEGRAALSKGSHYKAEFSWLEPPSQRGEFTVADLLAIEKARQFQEQRGLWVQGVWMAWQSHHALIRSWATRITTAP